MKEVTINELTVEKILKNTILWVQTIINPCHTTGIVLLVEDKMKTTILVGLFNQLNRNANLR